MFLALLLLGVAASELMLPAQGTCWIFADLHIPWDYRQSGGRSGTQTPNRPSLFLAAQIESSHEPGPAAGHASSVPDSLTATPAGGSAGSSHAGHVK